MGRVGREIGNLPIRWTQTWARDKKRIAFIRKNEGDQAAETFERLLLAAKAGTKGKR